jgi:hypothetical protein
MIDIKKFSELQKKGKQSFANQKQVVKKVMGGQTVLCPTCEQPLNLITPESTDEIAGICCKKGCTDIQLDFV